MSNLQEYESREEPEKSDEELLDMIRDQFEGFEWTVEGVKDRDEGIIPLPEESRVVTSVIEEKAKKILEEFCEENDADLIPADHTRQYPDTTLEGGVFEDYKIALDIKTARLKGNGRASSLTIGSYAGYFMEPEKKKQGCRLPYGAFNRHWVLAFLYNWDSSKDTIDMVDIQEIIVYPKWKIASKATGTGTTNHIGGVNDVEDLKAGNGAFESKEEFEQFWREKGQQ